MGTNSLRLLDMTAIFIFPLYSPAPSSPSGSPVPSPIPVPSEGWGEGGYGVIPWGSSFIPEVTTDIGATPVRENLVRVAFSTSVLTTGLLDSKDSLNPIHYTIEGESGEGNDGIAAYPVNVIKVEKVIGSTRAVDLVTDRPLSHYPTRYTLRCNDIYDGAGVLFINVLTTEFYGLQSAFEKPVPETFAVGGTRDFANPSGKAALFDPLPVIDDLNLGTFPYGDDGDYGHDEGIENLRKRVIRRAIVALGGFVWLQGYGVGIGKEGKKLNSASRRERIRARYELQLLEEPDVRNAKVSFKFLPDTPGIVWLVVKVLTMTNRAYKFDIPMAI